MDSSNLNVVSIFYSIQGEGSFTGTPSIFIRLWGCNLKCNFCDDELHRGKFLKLTFQEILEKIAKFQASHIVITGGEPTLYNLNSFIRFLQKNNYFVAVETNGFCFSNIKSADWITYSPKDWNSILEDGFSELKFIVNIDSNIDKILNLKCDKPIFIQPENYKNRVNEKNLNFAIELVLNYPYLKLSVQLHKLLNLE